MTIEGAYQPLSMGPVEAGPRPSLESPSLTPFALVGLLSLVCFFRGSRIKIQAYIFAMTILKYILHS